MEIKREKRCGKRTVEEKGKGKGEGNGTPAGDVEETSVNQRGKLCRG